ncbi:hypothetical protein GCK32_006267 [Trichostrongylus colubriformis]|uniref:Uncharacterized protein n=1 Tax=Trichostrongylus colubriformis TaxID=6319 RepID=A0AAN8G4C8_TRICO
MCRRTANERYEGQSWTSSQRDAFKRQFSRRAQEDEKVPFPEGVPVFGICLCVIVDCALIALVCVALHIDEDGVDKEDAEEFLSLENIHEATTPREAESQTSLHE